MALGLNSEASSPTSNSTNLDVDRGSIDSGYHSMIAESKRGSQSGLRQTTTFIIPGTEGSPERSPRKLHKAISTTFSGAMQAFSNTVRSTTSYIYPTAGEPELPSSEWAECETPKKQSRRSSIMSSVRSRTQRFSPRARDHKNESPELPKSPVPVTQEKAPALDVDIPNPSFSYESLGRSSVSRGSQLLAGVKLPAAAEGLWPGPTRMTLDQALGNDRRGTLHPASSTLDDPYVDQGLQHAFSLVTSAREFASESSSPETNKRYLSDDKGYFSEAESNADESEADGLIPACLKYEAPGSPEARTSSPCRHKDPAASHVHITSSASTFQRMSPSPISSSVPSGPKPSKPETLDGTAEPTSLPHSSRRTSSHHSASFEDALNALIPPYEDAMTSNPRSLYKQLSSDVYDADAESLDSNMGCRAAWERHRADRDRRYMKIVDMAPTTESDEEVGPELELKRSPSKKSVHYAEAPVLGTINNGGSEFRPGNPTGALRYAVEAIERPAFPVGDLAYAVEAIERPSVTTFDSLETVFQQRPLFTPIFNDTSQSTHGEQLAAGSILPKPRSRNGTPFERSRTVSAFSDDTDDTDDSWAITTHSPSCNAPPPFSSLHVRSEPARRVPSAIDALATYGDEQIRITGPANSGINPSLPSPFDGPGDQAEVAGSKSFTFKTFDNYDQVAISEQHDLQSPSPGTASSIQSPSNINTPQETLNAAKPPRSVSASLLAWRVARRKQKKSPSRMGSLPLADVTMNPRNTALEPDFSPPMHELNENSTLGKMPPSLGESAKITGGSAQKPSVSHQTAWKNRTGRDQASLEELTEIVEGSVRWFDPASKSKSSKKSPRGKRQVAAALAVTSSPQRMQIPRVRGKASPGESRENARSAVKDSKRDFESEVSIENSMSDFRPLHTNRRLGSTSYTGYELDSVVQASTSVNSRQELDEDLQQDNDKKVVELVSGDVTIGDDGESGKDAPRGADQKKNSRLASEVEKKIAVQRELERKSDRAYSRLVGKLQSGAPDDDRVREDDAAHKEGKPLWRP